MTDDIILKFTDAGILLNDGAYERIKHQKNPLKFAESLIKHLSVPERNIFVLTGELVDHYLGSSPSRLGHIKEKISAEPYMMSKNSVEDLVEKESITDDRFNFQVIQDTSKKSYTCGEIKDFTAYFNSRYLKLKGFLSRRPDIKEHCPIKDVGRSDDVVKIIGMVNDIHNTKNNDKIVEIEDDSGDITVMVHKNNHKLFEMSERIVKDEVIGVIGSRKRNLVIASELINPGIPRHDENSMDFTTVFISDTHVGSSTFLEPAFNKFIKWINGNYGNEKQLKIAQDVKYLVIAGDLVDGIGVYPNQEKELIITDIYEQYEEAARLIGEIDDIKIIIAPGNHDASRLAEPQPSIPVDYAKDLFKLKNVEFVSNPAFVSLDGIKTLIYHGRSFDDFAMTVKGMSHQRSELIMKELLEKRHVAPIYGERTPLASEIEDHLVIEEIPDVFHCGHVHINAYKKYKGVHLINSGTFQSQTEFQKIYNIVPTCGEVPVLHHGSFKVLKFT
ncbi:MAG: DNA-directed DNA polymerase II small subunit [Euryarchaeota archaeon]|nr:DNA-directed DNA polymerase II small subunit [Euryarchaeota archaeon]